jgi:iron complex outermembrane receptor protein
MINHNSIQKKKMYRSIAVVLILILFNLSIGIAIEIPDNQLRQEEELLLLSETFVKIATKTPKKLSKAPAIVTIITAEEIKNMGARTWIDVLETVPGFENTRGHHGNQIIGVRGVAADKANKIKVMIDGHSISEPLGGSAFHFNFSEMPVDFIQRIEIARGPGSALYGENAFLAVINIITKKAENIDGMILEVGGGSFNTQNYDFLFGKEFGDFKVSAYADYYKSDGAKLSIKEDGQGKSGHTHDWLDRFYTNLNISYKDFSLNYFLMDKRSGTNTSTSFATTDNGYFDITQMFTELKYKHQVNKRLSIKPRLYFDLFDWEFHNEILREGSKFKGNVFSDGLLSRRSTQITTWGGELELNYSLSERNNLLGGFQYQHYFLDDTTLHANFDPRTNLPLTDGFQDISDEANFIDPDLEDHLLAMYLQDEWLITDDIYLTVGGRLDHYDNFGFQFSPRTSLVWSLLDDLHLKFLYGEAFRAPDILEQTSRNNLASKGNPDIKPEKIRTYEFGIRYNPLKIFQGEINLFYNEIRNIIIFDSGTSRPQLYINGGEIKSYGVETSVKSEYSKDTYIMANYSFANPEDEDGMDLPDISKYKFNVVLNTYLFKYLNGNATVLFRGSKKREDDDPRDDIPPHCRVNLNLLAHNFYPNMEISASVHNLFDSKYSDPTSLKLREDIPREGRSFLIYLRYKF